jgi:hypothetical protein
MPRVDATADVTAPTADQQAGDERGIHSGKCSAELHQRFHIAAARRLATRLLVLMIAGADDADAQQQ